MNARKQFNNLHYSINKKLPLQCANCESTENLHIHHIVPISCGGSNRVSNMVRLCEVCHGLVHNMGFTDHLKSIQVSRNKLRESGKWSGGLLPFGYNVNEEGYLIPSQDAKTVRKILMDFYVKGKKMKDIKKDLELNNVKTAKGQSIWQHSTLSTILENTTYIGELRRKNSDKVVMYHKSTLVDDEHIEIVKSGMYKRRGIKNLN